MLQAARSVMPNNARIRQTLRGGACGLAMLALTASAAATTRIQKDAEAAGFAAASNCGYCHTFDSNHMKDEARKAGLPMSGRLDCYACHGNRLPKSGPRILNERGLFLTAAKRQFSAEKVDAAWLKTYREPSPAASPKGGAARK